MHSNISDGTLSPEGLLKAASLAHVHTLALTDHDSLDGIEAAEQAAKQYGIRCVRGVEITAQWSRASTAQSHVVHIVGLDFQAPQHLQALLHTQQQRRAARARAICDKLQQLHNLDIWPDVLSLVDGHADRISRSHIAQVLCAKGLVKRIQQAFDHYLQQGKPAYVKLEGPSLVECIASIHAAQGYAVLAHPTRYGLSATNIRHLVALFAEAGGDAVELPSAKEKPATRQMMDRLIAQHALKVSIGSDFHGEHMPWLKLGQVPALNSAQQGIWQDFRPASDALLP